MRTLGEIIESARNGDKPSHEECYWAMLALDSLQNFDQHALMDLAGLERNRWDNCLVGVEAKAEQSFERVKRALKASPKDWVGWENDPANPDFQAMRRIALHIADLAIKGELPNQRRANNESTAQDRRGHRTD